jgi:serpin B
VEQRAKEEPDVTARPATVSDEARREVADGLNQFTFALYRQAKEPENFCLSPFSAAMALGLLHLGARGETARVLGEALHLPEGSPHEALGSLLRTSSGGKGVEKFGQEVPPHELTVANSIWLARGYRAHEAYLEEARRQFAGKVAEIDVSNPAASARTINDWTANETRDRIKDLVSEDAIGPLTRLIIVNAVYLKAFWREPFREANTRSAAFSTERGARVEAPAMRQSGYFAHARDDAVQVLEMDYWPAEGAELSMILILPTDRGGLAAVEADLTASRFSTWVAALEREFVEIQVPKFRIETSLNLREALEATGLSVLFEGPDLSGISDEEGLHVDGVIHKTFIDVDEKGTEAAAATSVMLVCSALPAEPAKFIADHPFLYAIRDKATGAVLFVGRVADPSG